MSSYIYIYIYIILLSLSQVISLRELKVEYKSFETKQALLHRFDKFLVDDRIARLIPKFLGKAFYKRKRFPVPVRINGKGLKAEIEKGLKTAILPLSHHGACAMVNIGHTDMKADQIAENLFAAGEVLKAKYPGGWANIRYCAWWRKCV